MTQWQNKEYSMADFKAGYNDINSLCDCAEELLATVEHSALTQQQEQLDLIEPLVNEIADASDVLSEEFLLIAESKKSRSSGKYSKKRIEVALRKIYSSINEYHNNARRVAQSTGGAVANLTNKVVKKIQQQLDKVVALFFEFAQISLQSIMSKAELDALKSRNTELALIFSQYRIGQHS